MDTPKQVRLDITAGAPMILELSDGARLHVMIAAGSYVMRTVDKYDEWGNPEYVTQLQIGTMVVFCPEERKKKP